MYFWEKKKNIYIFYSFPAINRGAYLQRGMPFEAELVYILMNEKLKPYYSVVSKTTLIVLHFYHVTADG